MYAALTFESSLPAAVSLSTLCIGVQIGIAQLLKKRNRVIIIMVVSDFIMTCAPVCTLFGPCSISHLILPLFIPSEERGRWNEPIANTGLKIMTLWLCLSFAALCLSLRNSSLNTHSTEAGTALGWLRASSVIFFKYPNALLIWPPSGSDARASVQCRFQCLRVCTGVFDQACEYDREIKQGAEFEQQRKCVELLLLLACDDVISLRDGEQSLRTISPNTSGLVFIF